MLEDFDLARRSYPGSRRGLCVEWVNFKSKHPGYREIVPMLLPAIRLEKAHKDAQRAANAFCPEWKNFKTWLNQSCWTQEFGAIQAPRASGFNPPPATRDRLQATMDAVLGRAKGIEA